MGRTRASFASRWTSTRTQHHKHKAPCCVVALVDICELQAIEVPSLRIGLGRVALAVAKARRVLRMATVQVEFAARLCP